MYNLFIILYPILGYVIIHKLIENGKMPILEPFELIVAIFTYPVILILIFLKQ